MFGRIGRGDDEERRKKNFWTNSVTPCIFKGFGQLCSQIRPVLKDLVDRGLMELMWVDYIDSPIQPFRDLTEQGAGRNVDCGHCRQLPHLGESCGTGSHSQLVSGPRVQSANVTHAPSVDRQFKPAAVQGQKRDAGVE